jgi:hypothetical protein
MPRNKQFGYIFTGSFTGNDEMHLAVAHELGHGQFVLKHTFDKDYKLPQGKTDNLMDYTRGARHIAKWQWDLMHDPGVVMRVFERDKDAAVYTKKEIVDLLNKIRKSTGTNATVGTVVREKDIFQDKFIRDSADKVSISKQEFLASLTHEQAEAMEKRDTTGKAWDNNPITLVNNAHVKLKIDGVKDSVEFVISMNGYSATNKIFTAWITTEENRMIFYNAVYAAKNDKTTITDIKSNRKAFDITVHESKGFGTFEQLKSYLKIKGTIDFSETTNGQIVLELNRKKSNDYITVGELKVRNTDIKLFTLELGRDINNSSTSNCSTKKHDQYLCGRIKAGTYKFELNDGGGTAVQHRYKSLRLDSVPGRGGILIHKGNAYSWTQGCILLMVANEIDNILENPKLFMLSETQGFSNVEYQVPVLALYDYIEKYGTIVEIKGKKYIGEIVITDDDNVNISNDNNFTEEINYRREAARLYYDNEKSIQTILNNMTDSLMNAGIDNILYHEFSPEGKAKYTIAKIDSIIQSDNFKVKVKEKIIRDKITPEFTKNLITFKLTSIFTKITSNKDKIIDSFFRESTSAPFPPIYYIKQRYVKKTNKDIESYLEKKVTQKNIDDYIEQQKTYTKNEKDSNINNLLLICQHCQSRRI